MQNISKNGEGKSPAAHGELFAVVAIGRSGEIGFRGDMPWHLPEDLRHFKELTLGHPVIMGRATWMSLPKRPLPGRLNIVLTASEQNAAAIAGQGASTASGLDEALAMCAGLETPFIIGGGRLYAESLGRITRLFVTRIEADFPDADTYFPEIGGFRLVERSEPTVSKCGLEFRYETYERECHEGGDNQ